MQSLRNCLFYSSPLLGAVVAGVIGHPSGTFLWIMQILLGFVVGCAASCLMLILSIRARFKSDSNFTDNPLRDSGTRKS